MEKTIVIDGREVGFKASALTPKRYRAVTNRDFMQDIKTLMESMSKVSKDGSDLQVLDLEMFENIAYVMAKQYDPNIPDEADEWLDTFDVFSIYSVLPEILQLWVSNTKTTSVAKKK